ncbi:Enoyl-[acyl-carrier-protein] reductase [NADH], chloroplastic [Capsicum baccatum]|uniref:Enoyl-[acyl-carrier-protein] reductase [NADH], chloroplastic n=1 Tax=Capsicum baccatum TaxID=33114 RepID=A0A2G2W0U9_CAPBA|nr:Enoyl-[acyl-carrier-protein] reductase [NADH], chloroplastic [Capsicum baccatum]
MLQLWKNWSQVHDCRAPKKGKKKDQANMIESSQEYDDLCAMFTECNLVGNPREWWMDSGSTHHVCTNKELFSSFAPAQAEKMLYMANSATAKVEGTGKICLKMNSRKVLTLNNVLYVPELRQNLISVSLLDNNGFKCVTVSGKIVVSKGEIKDEAIDAFRQYKTEVENQLDKKIKMIRSDRGGEYESPFAQICVENGIIHQTTAPYSPQSNGIAERKNRTLKEMMNVLLISSSLPQNLWGEAILTANRILNRVPYNSSFWKEAVNSEIDSILSNHTWELVDLPPGNKPLGSKWIFKRKMKAGGTIDKYKARLVVKGLKQKEGLDYFDTYSPVTRITSIRMLIALKAVYDLHVKSAFLNGYLEEEICMEHPEGFVVPGKKNKIISRDISDINATKRMLESKFDMKDLGVTDVILGIRIHRTPQGLALSQSHYIEKVLDKFKYMEFGIAKTPLDTSFALRKNEDYVKSKDNVSDPLTKGLSREGVERTSKELGLRPRTSQHDGPLRSRAAKAIGFTDIMIDYSLANAPLPKELSADEVGNTAAFLASPLASAITGAVIYVDNGLNAMGVGVDSPIFKDLNIPKSTE